MLVSASSAAAQLRATIRTTDHGIPRILADNWKGLGFGYGYAFASQDICTMADSYVTVDGQRSRYFGPDKTWTFGGNGQTFKNIDSDFFFQRVKDDHVIQDLLQKPAPLGPKPQVIKIARGYAAGYDRYLADTGVANLPDPRCAGAPWVHPIKPIEVFRRFYALGELASQGVAIDGIAEAAPPAPSAPGGSPSFDNAQLQQLDQGLHPDIGSNAYGLGSHATQTGHGMVLANPHFPWVGSERFFESQLTIPGKIDVSGMSLYGVPLILIGHTRHLAWSHTVSTAYRFTPFQLTLVPGSPTTYLYDGQPRQMKQETVKVKALQPDGSLQTESHTFYSTVQGPVLTSLVGIPLPWTPTTAFAMGDANADNFRYLNHFFDVDRAQSTRQLYGILKRDQGVPWVNTIAADSRGRAFYADMSVVPHVTNAEAQRCDTAAGAATFAAVGLPILDGSTSSCAWGSDPDAVEPGIFGPSNLPHLFRHDYVENSNDSYWLANPNHPLEGYARIIGSERTARTLRTRLGLTMIQQRLDGTDGLPGKGFTLRDLQKTVFNDRVYSGELWRDQLVQLCDSTPVMVGSNGPVDVSGACPVLAAWDLHDNLGSAGAVLFQRFVDHLLGDGPPLVGDPAIYTTPFDASDPVSTPSGLNTADPAVQKALADAVDDLNAANIPLDASMGDVQHVTRNGDVIPIHGGEGDPNGVFNAIYAPFSRSQGYGDVVDGSSFVMAASMDGRCPDVHTVLTYSQSDNPNSPYYDDQTRLFSQKKWVLDRFCEHQIQADPHLQVTQLGGGALAGR